MGDSTIDSEEQHELYSLSMNEEKEWGNRYNAVCSLEDSDLLGKVALNAFDPDIRNIAIRKTQDQDILVQSALNDVDYGVRATATENLANWQRDTFKMIAIQDPHWTIRKAAMERLPSIYDEFFANIVITEEDYRVRKIAMRKMKINNLSEDMLIKLAIHAQDGEVRAATARKIENESLLKEIAIDSGDYVVAEEAIERITKQEYLKLISISADFAHTRMTAVKFIDDNEFLMEIARCDKNLLVRSRAIHTITSIDVLETMLLLNNTDVDEEIKERLEIIRD